MWRVPRRHFGKVIELTPNDADAHNNLGLVLMQRGEGEAAVKNFKGRGSAPGTQASEQTSA